ncbi:MAG TPA: hypothetical protein VGA00_08780 [Acidiferrobacterales bacterium]|jgi:hypothetical protein
MTGNVVPFQPRSSDQITPTSSLTNIDLNDRIDPSGRDATTKKRNQLSALYKLLNEVYDQSKYPDWDGDGAEAVALSTYQLATRLILCLPQDLENPNILADSDGYIEFEWYREGSSFSIYVTGTGVMLYAAYYSPNDRMSGRFSFKDKFPKHLVPFIQRVLKNVE